MATWPCFVREPVEAVALHRSKGRRESGVMGAVVFVERPPLCRREWPRAAVLVELIKWLRSHLTDWGASSVLVHVGRRSSEGWTRVWTLVGVGSVFAILLVGATRLLCHGGLLWATVAVLGWGRGPGPREVGRRRKPAVKVSGRGPWRWAPVGGEIERWWWRAGKPWRG